MGPALAATAVDTQEMGEAIAVIGTVRVTALFLVPLAGAGMLSVIPLVAAVALSGGLLAMPAGAALHRRGAQSPDRVRMPPGMSVGQRDVPSSRNKYSEPPRP
ncbi:MAG: hypothetical protein EKK42_18850 [Pseudonocardiaceae bacterium]|nr:MAG: hypothetical protein EKK42_18850 [Pseudonocardiaceae bacterium]